MAVSLKRMRRQKLPARKASAKAPTFTRGSAIARLAGDVWASMVQAVFARRDHMAAVAAKFDLTLPQAHLLRLLQNGPARTMTSIAEALACDASNVTGIVDRLESRKLIARGHSKADRRIKIITLTPHGKSVLKELTCGFLEPPAALCCLPDTELRRLHAMVLRAFGNGIDDPRWSENSASAAGAK